MEALQACREEPEALQALEALGAYREVQVELPALVALEAYLEGPEGLDRVA